jgi:hypothetical protein
MKRTIEIDDTLQDCIDEVIEGAEEILRQYLAENPDTDETPDLGNDLDYSGAVHELVDGAVPIYTAEIDGLFYLHGSKLEDAFDDAGIGGKEDGGFPCGWKAAAIFCYLEQQVQEWYQDNAENIFNEWMEAKEKPE